MTIRVDPFTPDDLTAIAVHAGQSELPADRLAHGRAMAAAGPCFTIRCVRGGDILLCGGAIVTHTQLATLWSVLSSQSGPRMMAITRRVRWFVSRLAHRRIDAMVRADFAMAGKWMALLGFDKEARLYAYFEDGGDAVIYRLKR